MQGAIRVKRPTPARVHSVLHLSRADNRGERRNRLSDNAYKPQRCDHGLHRAKSQRSTRQAQTSARLPLSPQQRLERLG